MYDRQKNRIFLYWVFTYFHLYYIRTPSQHIIMSVLGTCNINEWIFLFLPSFFRYFSLLSRETSQKKPKVIKMTSNLCTSFSPNNERLSTLLMKCIFRLLIDLLHLLFGVRSFIHFQIWNWKYRWTTVK